MGNQPSTEAYRESPLVPPPPDRPLPPIPPLSTRGSLPSHKLSKPRTRSTAGLLKSPSGFAKGTGSGRFSTSGLAQLVTSSFSSPNTPTSPSFAAHSTVRPLPPLPSSLSPASPAAWSPSVFTFEEAVVAVTGQQDPAAWRPVSSVYPSPSVDLELLQEQQPRQLEFQLRQRQNQLQYRQLQSEAQARQRELQLRRYTSFDFGFNAQGEEGADREEEAAADREPRKQQRQTQKQSKRRSFFRSRSSQRPRKAHDDHDGHDYRRRNSIASTRPYTADRHTWDNGSMTYDQVLSQYYGGPLSENWPPPAGSRTSWNYDMTSYAAKRLLHIVDDSPLDHRLEQASAASESKYSVLSELTWKSSHPVRPESPTLTRANSDLSLYAPVRRTAMMQVPGVATRRNSSSSFTSAGGVSVRPNFRHSHPAPTPSLSRRTSFESTGSRVQSMPPVLQRPDLSAYRADESMARVSTPSEGEYNAIGAFKLGSLRITNGSASPMSSPEATRTRKVDTDTEEPTRSPGFDFAARTRALAALSANAGVESIDNASTSTVEDQVTNRQAADKSNGIGQLDQLSLSLFRPSVEMFSVAEPTTTVTFEIPAPEPEASSAEPPQIEFPEDLFAGFEFSSFSFEEATALEAQSLPPAATALTLQTTSKTTAVEDELFEDDDQSTSGYASQEVLAVRLDPSAKPTPKRAKAGILAGQKSVHSIQSVSRSDSGLVSSPTSESSHKPLSKADSGYSSNVSLRSFKQTASKLMAPVAKAAHRLSSDKESSVRVPQRESFIIDELKLPSPTIDTPEMVFSSMSPVIPMAPIKRKPLPSNVARPPPPPQREAPPPPPPPPAASVSAPADLSKDMLPLSPVSVSMTDTSTPATSETSVPGLLGGSTGLAKKRHTAPAPLNTMQPAPHSDSQPSPKTSPNPLTPASVRSNGSTSALSIGSGTQRPNKLLRFINFANSTTNSTSSNRGPPAVHVTHIEDDKEADIPSIPSDVNNKLREHTGLFPLTTKRLALKTQMSRDTLKTIFSVGSLEAHSSSDLHAAKDEGSLQDSSHTANRRHTFQVVPSSLASAASAAVVPLKMVTSRRSRLSMAVDYNDEDEGMGDREIQQARKQAEKLLTDPRDEGKVKKAGRSWRRWGREGERQTPSPENISDGETESAASHSKSRGLGISYYDDTALATDEERRTISRSSSTIIDRTMSLTAQLERTLSLRIAFPRRARRSASEDGSEGPIAPPISAFSTAIGDRSLSPSLPSPLFAEAMAQQRRATMTPEAMAVSSPPVSARMKQMRPTMLRVPPPLRPQSTPPGEEGSRRVSRQSSQDSLYSMSSTQYYQATGRPSLDYGDVGHIASAIVSSPPPLNSPSRQTHPNWEVQTDHDSSGLSSRRQRESFEGQSRRSSMDYNTGYSRRESLDYSHNNSMVSSPGQQGPIGPQGRVGPQRSFSGDDRRLAFMASSESDSLQGYLENGENQDDRPRLLRHRASYDGYSNGAYQGWDTGSYAPPPQHNPATMSNGYTAPAAADPFGGGRRRSGSGSSHGRGNIYQLQQQLAWDYYYQQYARPPPNVRRGGSHHRNRSMGSRHGPAPGSQAPYRVLHSYNSPAYRGVPIWG